MRRRRRDARCEGSDCPCAATETPATESRQRREGTRPAERRLPRRSPWTWAAGHCRTETTGPGRAPVPSRRARGARGAREGCRPRAYRAEYLGEVAMSMVGRPAVSINRSALSGKKEAGRAGDGPQVSTRIAGCRLVYMRSFQCGLELCSAGPRYCTGDSSCEREVEGRGALFRESVRTIRLGFDRSLHLNANQAQVPRTTCPRSRHPNSKR